MGSNRSVVQVRIEDWDRLVRIAFLITSDLEASEDIVQDVILRITERERHAQNPDAYIRRAVTNGALSWCRTRSYRRRRPLPTPDLVPPEHLVEFRDLLLGLTNRQRAVVVGRYYGGLGDDELALILRCRPSTVRSLAARGLIQLRKAMTTDD